MNALRSQTAVARNAGTTYGGERTTHFGFQHKVFTLEQVYFSLTHDTKEPVLHVPLGDLKAALPLGTVRVEFSIAAESPDGKLLEIVERSLRYVREIRPNDSIPSELLDGSASWSVDERHRLIAQSRLAVQLSSWMSGEEAVENDLTMLEQLADDPMTKQRVQLAVVEIAERIGIGSARKQEVIDKIDLFARELSYIEALRERQARVKQLFLKLNKLAKVYRAEKSVTEDIVRIQQLLRGPINELEASFALVDAQTSEIMNILQKYEAQVTFVRQIRDDLNQRLSQWDDLLTKWEDQEAIRSSEAETLIKECYRFAAHNFPQQQSWRR